VAIFSAASATVATSPADAALYYWQDSDSAFYQPAPPPAQARRQKLRQQSQKKDTTEKDAGAKPQGPLIIAVSVGKQRLKVYDSRGIFAEAPVSTGMAGHSTPMGVFSVIQKHKLHHSNIYSNAPMPYMQRITWSGVALHAGVLPGYPASHGCIRMPMAFAVKMWNWTRMGARVVVTPGETTPAGFTHPLLPAFKIAPQPVVAEQPHEDTPVAAKADKGAPETKAPDTSLELRSTVGHRDAATSVANMTPVTLREQTHTADAKSMATMSDAGGVATDGSKAEGATLDSVKSDTAHADGDPSANDATQSAKSEAKPDAPKQDQAGVEPSKSEPSKAELNKAEPAHEAAKSNERPATTIKAASDGTASAPDDKKDQSRLAKAEPTKRTGQIAVFISRKDSRIYVRQNFSPLFDAPVTVTASDRPLGTHVFTAEVDKNDANALHWSVVSLPMSARGILHASNEEYGSPAEERARLRRDKAIAGAGQPGRSARPDQRARRHDGTHFRGADHRRIDHRFRSGHQSGRNRRRHGFHRLLALARHGAGG